MTDEEEHQDRTYKLGISEGLSRACGYVMGLARDQFQIGNDKNAEMLRAISLNLEMDSKKARPENKEPKK